MIIVASRPLVIAQIETARDLLEITRLQSESTCYSLGQRLHEALNSCAPGIFQGTGERRFLGNLCQKLNARKPATSLRADCTEGESELAELMKRNGRHIQIFLRLAHQNCG